MVNVYRLDRLYHKFFLPFLFVLFMDKLPTIPFIFPLVSKENETGVLTVFESKVLPGFAIQRSFWIMQVPKGEKRGVHAHKKENQVLICLKNSVSVHLENSKGEIFQFILDSPELALFLPPNVWSEVTFGEDAVLLVLADRKFDEDDYIRDKEVFREINGR